MLLHNNIRIACNVWFCFRTPRELFGRSRFSYFPPRFLLVVMSRRLYLGSTYILTQLFVFSSLRWLAELPPDTRSDDVSKFFDGYGKIIDCRVMTGQS